MDPYTVRSAILGLVTADALGVPVEFQSRETLKADPVTDMRAFGTYHQPAGTWSDDSTMALCLLESLTQGLDYDDQMDRFCRWANDAYMTPYDQVFDMGMATRKALQRYLHGTPALQCGGDGQQDNGNGSLMRILPLALYLHATLGPDFARREEAYDIIHAASSLTHAHPISLLSCGIYCAAAGELLQGGSLWEGVEKAKQFYAREPWAPWLSHFARIDPAVLPGLPEDAIQSSGYVLSTLEAALWCLLTTDNYAACVLKAVNLGSDTDTVAAIAGGLAGLQYGLDAIPPAWLEVLARREMIYGLCDAFTAACPG